MNKKLKTLILSLMISMATVSSASAVSVTVGTSCTQNFTNAKFYLGGSSSVPTRTSITGTNNGYISVGDLCTIKDTSNSTYWKIEYPTASGKKVAYAKKTDIFPNISNMKRIKVAANTTVYTNSSMKVQFGTVFATDTVTLLSPISNGKAQIIYNVSGGYKIGWIYAEESTTQTKVNMSSILYGSATGRLTCGFDGYVSTPGRHEGIDFVSGNGAKVYSLIEGEVINVVSGSSSSLSTIAIYDKTTDKTVIYLHTIPLSNIKVGTVVKKGTQIATESNRGSSSVHTHVEVRNGKKTLAAKSVNDYTLENQNPTNYWNSKGYIIK